MTVTVTDDAGDATSASFTVTVGPRTATPVVANDDGDWAYRERGIWQTKTAGTAWKGDYKLQTPGTGSRTANWTLTAPAGDYEVFATWQGLDTNATNATFKIKDGATPRATVLANQRLMPGDAIYNGVRWQSRSLPFFHGHRHNRTE